ncbi:hypothetical protein 20Aug470_00008 [Pseudomonas phage 20Aug470]|nr:hypothetical protein 20Aug470_00008 [Pseudomonas phage 20Aug470]
MANPGRAWTKGMIISCIHRGLRTFLGPGGGGGCIIYHPTKISKLFQIQAPGSNSKS